ncbi:MAG: sulfotransferase [Proteobacteria bacterium]|nr:sulfotransferase [Pseudomonadota bacterium]
MIIWLASYPKSGNTLLRSILGTYFYSDDGDFKFKHLYKISQFPAVEHFTNLGIDTSKDDEIFKNFIEAQKKINKENPRIKFFKTHSSLCKLNGCNFTDEQNTLGVIYIVRDPRNVVTSFAHHYNMSIDDATTALIDERRFFIRTDLMHRSFLSSWKFNFNSWKKWDERNKYLLIRYEDLVNRKKTILIRIFKFLKTLGAIKNDLNMTKLNRTIKSTEFQKMKKMEKTETFHESVIDDKTGKKKDFFNLGPKNNWRQILDHKNREKIENSFADEMKELGYL